MFRKNTPSVSAVTYEELIAQDPLPVLVLRRQPSAVAAAPTTSRSFPSTNRVVECIVQLSRKAKEKVEQLLPDTEGKQADSKDRNLKVVVQTIFCEMKVELNKTLDKAMEDSMNQMDQMTAEQQEQVLLFWDQMGEFLPKLLDWVDRIFDKVVVKIQEGHHIDRNVTAKVFKSISDALNQSLQ